MSTYGITVSSIYDLKKEEAESIAKPLTSAGIPVAMSCKDPEFDTWVVEGGNFENIPLNLDLLITLAYSADLNVLIDANGHITINVDEWYA
jgi:hypothetical protein